MLIDGDIVIYSCGFAVETKVYEVDGVPFLSKADAKEYCHTFHIPVDEIEESLEVEPESHALHNAKALIDRVCKQTRAAGYTIYITGERNFRLDVDSDYKANRDPNAKPFHYHALRNYLIDIHNATVVDGMEADDAMGIHQCSGVEPTVIASIDKDMDMIPGKHYNWRKDKLYDVTDLEGKLFFYKQLLIGDRVDNITGLPGIGPKKASKALDHLTNEYDMYTICAAMYEAHYGEDFEDVMHNNCHLLWILRNDNTRWEPPNELAKEMEVPERRDEGSATTEEES